MISKTLCSPDSRPRREQEWVGIVIHHTGMPEAEPKDASAWAKFGESMAGWMTKKDDAYLSAHFQINRDGSIVQIVDPRTHEAFHAGKSEWWHPRKRAVTEDWNRYAIGIELVGDGNRIVYSDQQYDSLAVLCKRLMSDYRTIHPSCIVGHEQIAPGRKSDPGVAFDWQRLFRSLYT